MPILPNITRLLFLCNIFEKEVSDEIDFLHVDKHESSLQINTMIFDGHGQTFPKFPKYHVCNVFTISRKTS